MLKSTVSLFALALLTSGAASAGILLERITAAGFVMPEFAASTRCTINQAEVIKKVYELGGLRTSTLQQAKIRIRALESSIAEAASGRLSTVTGPVDGPTIIYNAYILNPGLEPQKVTLYSMNGGIGQRAIVKSGV